MSIMRKVNFKNVTLFCEEMTRTLINFSYSVGGVTVSMVAFQAVDPGSTPGRRIVFVKLWRRSQTTHQRVLVVDQFVELGRVKQRLRSSNLGTGYQ